MSRLIDERVVEMGFDNREFESNVKTSMSTINNLKSSLDFSGVSTSMNKAFSGVNTSILAGGVQAVAQQFSTMQIAAITAISNITNRLVDLGINMVKSLSIDNIMVGWEKYGEKTKSVGTLVAQGYDMDVVNTQLEKLAWYTDETSYSFTEMVSSISKFTASGQSLDSSVQAMMGIANWAALSGQNTQTASRAMYQLAQAIGSGSVKLQDWRSIQNANMDTQEFRQSVLDAAVAAGKLNRTITGEYATQSGKTFGINQFTEFLSEEGWFTSEVLMKTLGKYSSAVDTLYEKVKVTGEATTSSEAMEMFEKQLDEFGLKAFRAAQEARTLRDALNAIKEAVGSAWTQVFENIFGAYDDAKTLWTDLSYELYDIFVPGLQKVNAVLKEWNVLGGRNDIFENTKESTGAFWNLFRAVTDIVNVIKGAWNIIFPLSEMEEGSEQIKDIATKLKGLTEGLKAFAEKLRMSEETSGKLSSIFQGLFSIVKFVGKAFRGLWTGVQPLVDIFRDLVKWVFDLLAIGGTKFTKFVDNFTMFETIGYYMAFGLKYLIDWVKNSGVIQKAFEKIGRAFNFVKNTISAFVNGIMLGRNSFGSALFVIPENLSSIEKAGFKLAVLISTLVERFKELNVLEKIKSLLHSIKNGFVSAWESVSGFAMKLTGLSIGEILEYIWVKLKGAFEAITGTLGEFGDVDFSGVKTFTTQFLEKFKPVTAIIEGLFDFFMGLWSLVRAVLPVLGGVLSWIGDTLSNLGKTISAAFGESGGIIKIQNLFDAAFWGGLLAYGYWMISALFELQLNFASLIAGFIGIMDSKAMQQYAAALKDAAIAFLIFVAALVLIASIDQDKLAGALVSLGVIMGMVVAMFSAIMTLVVKLQASAKSIGIKSLSTAMQVNMMIGSLVEMAIAILLLAFAVKIMSTIKIEDMITALLGLTAVIAIMSFAAITIARYSKITDYQKGVKGLISLAVAVLLLSIPLKTIAELSMNQLKQGVLGVSFMVTLCLLFASISGKIKGAVTSAFGMILFSIALGMMVVPLFVIGKMDWGTISRGLFGMLSVLAIMYLFGQMSGTVKGTIMVALSLIPLSAALLVFATSMKAMGLISWKDITMAMWSLLLVVGSLYILAPMMKGSVLLKMSAFGLAIIPLSLGLMVFATAMKALGTINWKDIGMAMASIVLVLALFSIFAGVFGILSPMMVGFGIALMALSAGLIFYAAALKALGLVKFLDVLKSMYILALTFAALAIVAKLMKPFIVTMFALSAVFFIFAAAALMVAVSLSMMAVTLGTFGVALANTLIVLADAIIQAGPKIAAAIGTVIMETIKVFTQSSTELLNFLNTVLTAVLKMIIERSPDIAFALVILLSNVLIALQESFPSIAESLIAMLVMLLTAIKDQVVTITNVIIDLILGVIDAFQVRIPEIFRKLGSVVTDILDAIVEMVVALIPRLVTAAFDLIIGLIDGLGQAIEDNSERLRVAMVGFAQHMWNALFNFFGADKTSALFTVGSSLIESLKGGLVSAWKTVVSWFEGIGKDIEDFFTDLFKSVKFRVISGSGSVLTVEDLSGWPKGARRRTERNLKESAIGYGESLNDGFEDSGVFTVMQKIYDLVTNGISDDLVIRPVMDLTEIQNGTRVMHGMLSGFDGYSIKATSTSAMADKTYKSMRESEISRAAGRNSDTNLVNPIVNPQENTVINNTFNISGANPKEIANEVSRELGRQIERRNAKWASAR